MGQQQSDAHFEQHLPSYHPSHTQRQIFHELEYSNSNSFRSHPPFHKKSSSFVDSLPKDRRHFRDDTSSFYNVKTPSIFH